MRNRRPVIMTDEVYEKLCQIFLEKHKGEGRDRHFFAKVNQEQFQKDIQAKVEALLYPTQTKT
jgi:hypothetical protein